MRANIRKKIAGAQPSALQLSSGYLQDCLSEVVEGKAYKLRDIANLWSCSHEFVRRQFVHEPGVIKFEGMYLVPECVVKRVVRRLMI